jgi:hypothetical protein
MSAFVAFLTELSSKLAQYGLLQPLQDMQRYQDAHPSVSSKPSKIPYGGFSPVRLQMQTPVGSAKAFLHTYGVCF